MPQHDFDVANGGGAAVRGDINAALLALASLSLGATAPATTFAGMLWLDTTLHVLKQRNEANSAWRIIDRTDVEGVLVKTANYTVLPRDFGKLIDCTSGTFTLALTPAATLTDGFRFAARNSGTGVITIDPDSSETIDGVASITLGPGESCLVYGNGTLFRALCRDSISGLIEDTTPDAAADFVRTFDASANAFKKVKLENLVAASSGIVAGTPLVLSPYNNDSTTSQGHGLGATPTFCVVELECINAAGALGYALGDIAEYSASMHDTASSTHSYEVVKNATNVILITQSTNVPYVVRADTRVQTAITEADWKMTVKPFLVT